MCVTALADGEMASGSAIGKAEPRAARRLKRTALTAVDDDETS